MKPYITFLLLLTSIISYSQSFEIFKGEKTEKIITSDFLEVGVRVSDDDCCNLVHYEGFFTSSSKDSITFNFSTSVVKRVLDSLTIDTNPEYLYNGPKKMIAKTDILYITDYKSKKNKKVREKLSVIGGLVMIGGLATTINALIFADNNKSTLLIAGGIQIVAGFTVGLSSHKSAKKFKKVDDPWMIK